MKKYNKLGHLQGNTDVSVHSSPYILGSSYTNSSGIIPELAALSTPWSKTIEVQTDQGSYKFTFTDTTTNGGTLSDIVDIINNLSSNNGTVIASNYGGVLKVQASSSGTSSYIRINDTTDTIAYLLGFTVHPHSTATVRGGDLLSAAVNAHDQGNPTGTSLLANGEDRSSANYNRAVYSAITNSESNRTMLNSEIGVIASESIGSTSTRLRKNPANGLVYAIDLSAYAHRVLVGTLTKNSTIRDIRHLFKVANLAGEEVSYVSNIVSGSPVTVGVGTQSSLTATPNTGATLSQSVGDGGCALSADIPKQTTTAISSFIDRYTLECSGATFKTNKVATGDVLTISGSLGGNDNDYYVESVISETIIEIRPLNYERIDPLNTTSVSGSVLVSSGGYWLKGVSLILADYISPQDVIISLPIEKTTGTLPEDSLLDKSIVDMSLSVANMFANTRTLGDVYNNPAADVESAGGFSIDITKRPIHVNGKTLADTRVTGTPVTVPVVVEASNTLRVDGVGSFTDSDIGKVCLLNASAVSSIPGKADVISTEPVIIEDVVTAEKIRVVRIRTNTALPTGSTVYNLDVYTKNPTVTLPGSLVNRPGASGGFITIIEGTQSATTPESLESKYVTAVFDTVKKLQPTGTNNSVAKVASSTQTVVSVEQVSADMLNGLYYNDSVPHKLLCHILNGPNAGFYLADTFVDTTTTTTTAEVSLLDLEGNAASLVSTSITQYVSFYYAVSATSPISASKIANSIFVTGYGTVPSIGLSVSGAGNAKLVRLANNENTVESDLQAGNASRGTNLESVAGPGIDYNVYLNTTGVAGWDSVQNTGAVTTIGAAGLGGYGIYATSTTYRQSPKDNPGFYDSTTLTFAGGSRFTAAGPDAAMTVDSNSPTVPTTKTSTDASLVVANSLGKGAVNPAVVIYGDVYAPSHEDTDSTWYTEARATFSSIMSSSSNNVLNSNSWDSSASVGSDWVVGRIAGGNRRADLLERDYTKFNIPHEFIVKVTAPAASSSSTAYPTIFELNDNYIGSHVFIESPDPAVQSVSEIELDVGTSTHPFGMGSSATFSGPAKGFKVIGQYNENGSYYYAVEALSTSAGVRRIENVTNINLVFVRKPFVGKVDVGTSMSIGRTDYTPTYYTYDGSAPHSMKHPVLFSRELDRTVDTTVIPKSVTSQGSLLFGDETYWNSPIVDIESAYRKAGVKVENSPANYFRTRGTVQESTSKSFFTRKVTVHSLYDNVTSSTPSHFVSDGGGFDLPSPYNQQGYQAFRGGGSKLALFSKFWDETQLRDTYHYVRYAVGASLLTQQSSITVNLKIAHLYRLDKEVKVKLCTSTEVLAEKTFDVYQGVTLASLPSRIYRTHEVTFSRYELDAASIPTQKADLFIEVEVRTKSGYVRHTDLSTESDLVMDKLARTVFYREDYFGSTNVELHDFPDAVFIADMHVNVETKQAALTSGLDVEGVVNTRALRLSKAAKGFNTVGPASVDLLQNSEYGSLHGNGILPNEQLSAVAPLGEVTEGFSREGTIEGNDVGLLPLWKALFPSANNLDVLEYINDSSSTRSEASASEGMIINGRSLVEADIVSYDGSIPFSTYNENYVVRINLDTTTLSSLVFNSDEAGRRGIEVLTDTPDLTNMEQVGFNNDISFSPNLRTVTYFGAHVFVTFYKPTYDRATFFRKGAHSAAIHGYHPYYDPMFYWLNAAYGINKGRGLTDHGGSTNNAELGSFRLNKTRTYQNLTASKVNPDAVKLPGKTGFIVPLDPPHGARLSKLDLNLSIRPMVSRKLNKTDNTPNTDLSYSYGIWYDSPELSDTGTEWLGKLNWSTKEGYTVKIWRHSLFDSGNYIGDPGTDPLSDTPKSVSNHSVPGIGNAECIYSKDVNLRTTEGNPSEYANSTQNIIKEAVSRFSETLSNTGTMVANREVYSYFATVEFYIGVRKEKPFSNSDGSGDLDCYTIPGLSHGHMDHYNSIHFPYMWNTMYSHKPPTEGVSYGNGMAESSLWQGLWVPHGDPFRGKYYEQAIVRGHILNRAKDTSSAPIDRNLSKSFPTTRADITSVPSAFGDTNGNVPMDSNGYTLKLGKGIQQFRELSTAVPNQQLWYPIVKFRGARLTYLIDRPGHGGWGGDIS